MIRVLELIQIFLIYSVSILGLGDIISRSFTQGKGVVYRFLFDLVVGNFYIINMTFLLAYLKLWYRPVLVFTFLAGACVLRFIFDKQNVVQFVKGKYIRILHTLRGEVGYKYASKIASVSIAKYVLLRCKQVFIERGVELVLVLILMGINLYYYSYQPIHFVSYAAPDVEVHLSWIQSLVGGELFPKGVYPFGMHCIGAALCVVFDIPAVVFARMFGTVTTMYIIFVGYLFVRYICKQKYAPFLGFMVFTIANIMIDSSYVRYSAMISQEYAMIFLCPMMLFIYRYLQEKKKIDLILFGMCVSLTLAIHFYITAIALFFCLAVGLVYLYRIIKEKILLPILICGITSIVIAILPLVVGLLMGYELEQSFNYGASVVTGDKTLYMDASEYTEEELEEEQSKKSSFYVEKPYTMEKILENSTGLLKKYVFSEIAAIWLFFVPMALMVLNYIWHLFRRVFFKKKITEQVMVHMSLLLYTLFLFEQTIGRIFDWIVIIEPKRMAIFLFYVMPALIAIGIDIFYVKTTKGKISVSIWNFSVLLSAFGFIVYTYVNDLEKPLTPVYYFQTKGAMEVACDIIDQYEDYSWTIVSPVNETSVVKNHGYHHESITFLADLEYYKPGASIYIPTEYIFFFVEKMPIQDYGLYFQVTDPRLYKRNEVNKEAVFAEIKNFNKADDSCYQKSRMEVMSRMYYWAQAYRELFPDEMTTYYEDEEIVVYRLKQNPYALNNLAINYKERIAHEGE